MKLFLIAGHGEGDSGAVGGGYTEAERVRALAAKIKELGGEAVILGDTSKISSSKRDSLQTNTICHLLFLSLY